MPSQLTPQYPETHANRVTGDGRENRADIARVLVALGLLALLASFDDPKDTGLVAATVPAGIDASTR